MGIARIGRSGRSELGWVEQFVCDEAADVEDLPTGSADAPPWSDQTAPGSSALVAETKELYSLTPARTWASVAVLP